MILKKLDLDNKINRIGEKRETKIPFVWDPISQNDDDLEPPG